MESEYASGLESMLRKTEVINYLKAVREANIPNSYLAAGVIRNTVWKELFGGTLEINDIDVPYFSKELPMEMNQQFVEKLEKILPTGKWECDNQAWVHLYEPRSDYWMPHAPYNSMEDSIQDFWFTVNTIMVRLNENDELEIVHPEALEDLFNGILRLTPVSKTNPYPWLEKKIERIISRCPQIQVVR